MHVADGFKRGNDCLTAFIREGSSSMKRRISTGLGGVFCHPDVGRKQSLAPTVL